MHLHRDGENFITVGRVGLDFCSQAGIPKANSSILATSEKVFCGSFGIPGDVYGSFVILESSVQSTRERFRTSGRCHEVLEKTDSNRNLAILSTARHRNHGPGVFSPLEFSHAPALTPSSTLVPASGDLLIQ